MARTMYTINPTSTKDYVGLCVDDYNQRKNMHVNTESTSGIISEAAKINEDIINKMSERANLQNSYIKFIHNTKGALLSEALFKIYQDSRGIEIHHEGDESVARNLISNFIEEQGVNDLLFSMRNGNATTSELANLVDKYYHRILEGVDKKRSDSFIIPSDIKDDFFKDLNICDTGEATVAINMRVTDAIDEFISKNIQIKAEIEKTMKETQERISLAKTDVAKENAELRGKSKIVAIRNRKPCNVFSAMVTNMAEAVMKHTELGDQFIVEGKIDMQKVIDRTKIMYSFLEMTNTLGLINVNEDYITEVLESMRV